MPHGQCIAVAVHVQVPSDLREGLNLSAKASNGLIEVRDADSTFDHVKFRLRNGAIMARKLRSKDLDARTRNGRIALESITSDKVELSSHNGAVATGLVTADTIKLSAKNGAVSGRFEKFSQLEARTTNGAVNAACVVDDDKKPHMNFQSVNGRIEARISDNFSGHFEALAKVGKVSVKGDGIEFTERHRFLPAKEVGWRNGHGEMIVEASTATGHVNLEFGPL
ncbi:hypothetical protein BC832DRAFT_47534 [Gaertneriomyces semiglobifer]|nr:hypothetical protein BC832DRAFT_47534 [Gaertneriomyces semiglobifer]